MADVTVSETETVWPSTQQLQMRWTSFPAAEKPVTACVGLPLALATGGQHATRKARKSRRRSIPRITLLLCATTSSAGGVALARAGSPGVTPGPCDGPARSWAAGGRRRCGRRGRSDPGCSRLQRERPRVRDAIAGLPRERSRAARGPRPRARAARARGRPVTRSSVRQAGCVPARRPDRVLRHAPGEYVAPPRIRKRVVNGGTWQGLATAFLAPPIFYLAYV